MNQFLIDDEEPTLIRTGEYAKYEDIRRAIGEVLDPGERAIRLTPYVANPAQP